ncbi:aldehyde dehydrogenase family protein [Pigmentiphaga sp.]|uniref:aldehyde dehydrogenase family protein n=1 Tax=Pigmentiphaga sp. TaxID=1977564 RepID=UPI0025D1840B|nr:aldehyde dehydrogenase family protein [Pigmentiphaga sp.]
MCAAGERFFVHRSRIDDTLAELSKALATLRIGDPLDEDTQFGPLSNKAHFEKINSFFAQARSEGDTIVYGGQALDRPGYFVEPTPSASPTHRRRCSTRKPSARSVPSSRMTTRRNC